MSAPLTSLSAGTLLRDLLLQDATLSSALTKVYPIIVDEAKLPYILYRRTSMEQAPTKAGYRGADTLIFTVTVFAQGYAQSVQLAEAARAALDGAQYERDGLRLRSCTLTDSSEDWADGAYQQEMTFTVRI